jgi:hypothetical protein
MLSRAPEYRAQERAHRSRTNQASEHDQWIRAYNALNSDTLLTLSNSYANWLQPFLLINARFAKVSTQVDF